MDSSRLPWTAVEPVRTCEITGCGRPAKPSSINSYCDRHAGFLPWLGASAGMLGVVIVIGLVLAGAALVLSALT